jgi:predicted secreted hydrolase
LFTGAFLVFSTQALSVLRRRSQFALLRVLGLPRRALLRQVLVEGASLGVIGALARHRGRIWPGGGRTQLLRRRPRRRLLPRRETDRRLHPGGGLRVLPARPGRRPAGLRRPGLGSGARPSGGGAQIGHRRGRAGAPVAHLALAAVPGLAAACAFAPPVFELPLFGYFAVALLLIGGIGLMPRLAASSFRLLNRMQMRRPAASQSPVLNLALARLANAPGQASIALGGVLASFSLMVAMGIMVASFRVSVDDWILHILPADLYVRTASGGNTGGLGAPEQAAIAALPGVSQSAFLRTRPLTLDPSRPAITLIARDIDAADPGRLLALVGDTIPAPAGELPLWVSEAMTDLYGFHAGQRVELPLGGRRQAFFVAGVWRDYANQSGSVVVRLADYRRLTGDTTVTDAALWASRGVQPDGHRRPAARPALRRDAAAGQSWRDPRRQPQDLRPQLRRHLSAGGDRDRHRPVRRGRHLLGPDPGARPRIRHAASRRRVARPGAAHPRLGRRLADRAGRGHRLRAGSVDQPDPGVRRQPAVLPLDHAAAPALAAAGQRRRGAGHGLGGDGAGVGPLCAVRRAGARREGGLVMLRSLFMALLLLAGALGLVVRQAPCAAGLRPVTPGRTLVFPQDFGAHPEHRTEWWYVTGWLDTPDGKPLGFQLTFFRSRTEHDPDNPSAFAPKQLVIGHAALSDPATGHLLHDQRSAREGFGLAWARTGNTDLRLEDWSMRRGPDGRYQVSVRGGALAFELQLAPTQPLLLQGEAGFSRKGPKLEHASYYYSEPQLKVAGSVTRGGKAVDVKGSAWLDHEWSSQVLEANAAGWDWAGINLDDGGALMAFQIRGKDGGKLWAHATLRDGAGRVTQYSPEQVSFTPQTVWKLAAHRRQLSCGDDDRDRQPALAAEAAAARPGTRLAPLDRRRVLGRRRDGRRKRSEKRRPPPGPRLPRADRLRRSADF